MKEQGRWDMSRLGKIHTERCLRAINLIAGSGEAGLSISDITERVYNGDSHRNSVCRHLWETAINDLGIIGMVKHKVVKGIFCYYLTLEGKLFLEENPPNKQINPENGRSFLYNVQ